MELAIQKHLREHGLEATVEKYALKINEDDTGLIQFNYHMIDSPRGIQECDECRGLILDSNDNWNVVAYPFYRFYNEGEGPAAKVNLKNAKLQEKMDGSMIILYWHPYKKVWTVATRGSVLASGPLGQNEDKTFSDLFWNTMGMRYPQAMAIVEDMKQITFVFELIGPENRILTLYPENELRLLAARNTVNFYEAQGESLDYLADQMNIPRPKEYEFKTHDDIVKILESFNPTEEGFVLVEYGNDTEPNNNRVKIKNPRYLALSHLLGAGDEDLLNSKRLVTLIRTGEIDEVLSYFPEYEPQIIEMKRRLESLTGKIEADLERLQPLSKDKKAFAMEAKKTPWPHALFAVNNGKADSVYEYVINMREEGLLDILQKM
jgi:hypothetical protein